MSYKTEFQANNVDLQGLIDTANALPDHENLDSELATQDTLIADIMTALEGKTGANAYKLTMIPLNDSRLTISNGELTLTVTGLDFTPKGMAYFLTGSESSATNYIVSAIYDPDNSISMYIDYPFNRTDTDLTFTADYGTCAITATTRYFKAKSTDEGGRCVIWGK